MEQLDKTSIGLKRNDLANLFSAYRDDDDMFFYAGRTITFGNIDKLNEKYVTKHVWKDGDTWYNLAHRYYENSKVWWIICKANNVNNPFELPENDQVINIPNKNVVQNVINKISA